MYEYKIKEILKVYDGDTITVMIDLGFGVQKKEKLRLALIDAPEVRGESRPEGLVSRDWLRQRLNDATKAGEDIIIRTFRDRKGKYGRYIAVIYINEVDINLQMINEGHAIAY